MTEMRQTEARATIAAYVRGEITIEEAERRAREWYAMHIEKHRQPEKGDEWHR